MRKEAPRRLAKALFTSLTPAESPRKLLVNCDRAMTAMNLPTLRICLCPKRTTRNEARFRER